MNPVEIGLYLRELGRDAFKRPPEALLLCCGTLASGRSPGDLRSTCFVFHMLPTLRSAPQSWGKARASQGQNYSEDLRNRASVKWEHSISMLDTMRESICLSLCRHFY